MIIFDPDKKTYYSDKINDDVYISGFGTRLTGDTTNKKNIDQFFKNISCSYKVLAVPGQTHSTNIEEIYTISDTKTIISLPDRDGLVTKKSETALMVWTADCVPIIFVDKKTGIIGISHQGWKGTLNKMASHIIERLVQQGADKESIIAVIGPSIGACCYNIDVKRAALFEEAFPDFFRKIIQIRENKRYLNLIQTNYRILKKAGILEKNIDYFPFCTQCNENKFFSYRREGQEHGNMISYIMKL